MHDKTSVVLLSGRPRVRIAPGTPGITPKALIDQGFRLSFTFFRSFTFADLDCRICGVTEYPALLYEPFCGIIMTV